MPSYAYRAVHASGRVSRGEMHAAHENELAHYLSESGLELIQARETQHNGARPAFFRTGISPRLLALFCMQMHDLLQSGIGFPDALRDVAAVIENKTLTSALAQVSHALSTGAGIANSFVLCPDIFSPLFIAIVGAGEKTGDMTSVFSYLAASTEHAAKNAEKMRRALRYPLFLFCVAGSAVLFMMTMVIPPIVQFLNGIQGHPPFSTRILVALSDLFTHDGYEIIGGFTFLIGVIFAARKIIPSFAFFCDALVLRLPVIGALILKLSLARFMHCLAILFQSGCGIHECMTQAAMTLTNRALQQCLADATDKIISGASLSDALAALIPRHAVGLLRTGERSGNMQKSLHDLAIAYEREAQESCENFIGILEPALTLSIGAILAWTVIAVLGPLYGSLSILGRRM